MNSINLKIPTGIQVFICGHSQSIWLIGQIYFCIYYTTTVVLWKFLLLVVALAAPSGNILKFFFNLCHALGKMHMKLLFWNFEVKLIIIFCWWLVCYKLLCILIKIKYFSYPKLYVTLISPASGCIIGSFCIEPDYYSSIFAFLRTALRVCIRLVHKRGHLVLFEFDLCRWHNYSVKE